MKNPTLPDWYIVRDRPIGKDAQRRGRHTAGRAVRRALGSLAEALAAQLRGAVVPDSWLSRIDPAAKVVGIVVIIICATLVQGLAPLSVLLASGAAITLSVGTSRQQIGRIWLGVPLLSLAAILPSILNVISPGHIILALWRPEPGATIGPWHLPEMIGITAPGLAVAGRLLLRVMTCVTFAALLTATTEQAALINGLRRLGIPKVFGMLLAMMQRYLSALIQAAEEIHLAKLSRTLDGGAVLGEQRWVSSGIGSLFRRTHRLAEEIHNAMISRGYDGEIRIMQGAAMHRGDYVWIALCILASTLLVILDRVIIG